MTCMCLTRCTRSGNLVINLVTGPNPGDIEIILPVILARALAGREHLPITSSSRDCSALIFACGIVILPCSRSSSKPSQVHCWDGVQLHFTWFVTKPALLRSSWTNVLAICASFFPLTATIPSCEWQWQRQERELIPLLNALNHWGSTLFSRILPYISTICSEFCSSSQICVGPEWATYVRFLCDCLDTVVP